MKYFNKNNIAYFISFIFVVIIATIYLNKFENKIYTTNGKYSYSAIYSEDTISYYFNFADKIKKDLKQKNYLQGGHEVVNSYLHPRIIYFFNRYFNDDVDLIDYQNKNIELKNYKIFIYLQIILYFFSVYYFFYSCRKYFLNEKLFFFYFILLLLNPILIQWHFQFGTESIYFSLLIVLTTYVLKEVNAASFFFIGILLGILYLQRTVTILYPVILLIYLQLRGSRFHISVMVFFGMALVLLLLGFHNYKRSGIFYFTPTQSKTDFFTYIEIPIVQASNNISRELAIQEITNKHAEFINKQKLNMSVEKDRLKLFEYIRENSFDTFFNNKLETSKIIIKNYLHSLLLNPFQVYSSTKYQSYEEYKASNDHRIWLKYRIIFTLLFYALCMLGFIMSFKTIALPINILFILSSCYFFITGCWLSNSRYFAPSMIFLNLYLALGLLVSYNFFTKLVKKTIYNN